MGTVHSFRRKEPTAEAKAWADLERAHDDLDRALKIRRSPGLPADLWFLENFVGPALKWGVIISFAVIGSWVAWLLAGDNFW